MSTSIEEFDSESAIVECIVSALNIVYSLLKATTQIYLVKLNAWSKQVYTSNPSRQNIRKGERVTVLTGQNIREGERVTVLTGQNIREGERVTVLTLKRTIVMEFDEQDDVASINVAFSFPINKLHKQIY